MNILIIGNADSPFVKNLIQHIYLKEGHILTILSPSNTEYNNFYDHSGVRVKVLPPKCYWFTHALKSCIRAKRLFKGINFDSIQIHYVTFEGLLINILLKTKSTRSAAVYWGSDLFRASSRTVFLMKLLLRFADVITLSTSAMLDHFRKDYGNKYNGKIQFVKFGNAEFEHISSLKATNIDNIRRDLQLPVDKYIIAIGYNQNPAHQHIKVLEQIQALPLNLRRQMHLILRLTYGNAPSEYLQKLQENLKRTECSYTCYTDFLSEEKIAKLERATDIFVHAQISDAFSATVQEHLFAGALLINPQWIHYHELKENQVYYLEYQDFKQLQKYITDYIHHPEIYQECLKHNAEKIYAISSWEAVTDSWKALLPSQ